MSDKKGKEQQAANGSVANGEAKLGKDEVSEARFVPYKWKERTTPLDFTKLTLPSRGLLYGDQIPGGVVQVAPTSTNEEKLFLSVTKRSMISIFSEIITKCVRPMINPQDLLGSDREFLILAIKSLSMYRRPYYFRHQCSNCYHPYRVAVNLMEHLMIEERVKYLERNYKEPFEVTLPYNGHKVELRQHRVRDEGILLNWADRRRQQGDQEADPSYVLRIGLYIVSVNGDILSNSGDKELYAEHLASPDAFAIQEAIEERGCGLDRTIHPECPKCQLEDEFALPVTAEFFRPDPGGRERYSQNAVLLGKIYSEPPRGDESDGVSGVAGAV